MRRSTTKPMVKSGTELKFIDKTFTLATIGTSPVIALSSAVTTIEGTGADERIGRLIRVKSIFLRYTILLKLIAGSAGGLSDIVRIWVVHDKMNTGVNPAVLDVLTETTVMALPNLLNSTRFTILMDRVHCMNSTSGAGNGSANDFSEEVMYTTFYKKVSYDIEYDAVGGSLSDLSGQSIFVIICGDAGLTSFVGRSRVRFSE